MHTNLKWRCIHNYDCSLNYMFNYCTKLQYLAIIFHTCIHCIIYIKTYQLFKAFFSFSFFLVDHALPIFWWLDLLKVYQKWFTFKSIKLKDIIFQSQCRCNWNKRRKSLLLNPVRQFGKQSPVRLYHKWMTSQQFISYTSIYKCYFVFTMSLA